MFASPFLRRSFLTLVLSLATTVAFAQDKPAGADFEPEVGQSGKDVVWVPTPQSLVDKMLDIAKVTSADYVIDLGSGDGRTVITAAKRGARALGIEYNPDMVALSQRNAAHEGVSGKATFMKADLFESDFSKATVITMFLLPDINLKLRPKILKLKPGTRIVSHDFAFGDWQPDRTTRIRKNVFLWIVPAPVAGRWRARLELPPIERLLELEFTQRFQEVTAHARLNGVPSQVWETKLAGDRLSFIVVDTTDRDNEASLYFEGRVNGDVIEGRVRRGVGSSRSETPWRAARISR